MNLKYPLVLAIAAFSAATAFCDLRSMTPTVWPGYPKCWQQKHYAKQLAAITNGGAKVVFIGDSITQFWDDRIRGSAVWNRWFAGEPYKAINLGVSADRTEHVLWRITEGRELDGYEAKCIILMIGTNNSGHRYYFTNEWEKEEPIDTIAGIHRILQVIREKQPKAKVVLTAIFPRGKDGADTYRRRNSVVNREIAKYANGRDIFWLDFSEQFLTPDGKLLRAVCPDYLHPHPYGYEIWANAVKPYIDYALADGRLPPPNRYSSCVRAENFGDLSEPACPVARIGEGGDWWERRMIRNREQICASKGEIDLVFLGDSITHYWESTGAAAFIQVTNRYSVLSCGYGGDGTQQLLWRVQNGELDGYKAKGIMLMIGTNNTWWRGATGGIVKDTVEGIREILRVIREKQPQAKVLLLPIFPMGDSPKDERRVKNESINGEIKKFADGQRVVWLDFNAKFLDERGSMMKYTKDGCHPNAQGYSEVWLPAVMPYFQQFVGR